MYDLASQGVATQILKRNNFKPINYQKKDYSELLNFGIQLLKKNIYDSVITGTSWGPTIDKAAILGANYFEINSISILEYWSLYVERFSEIDKGKLKKKLIYLPKKVLVPDRFALKKMRSFVNKDTDLEVVGNPYFQKRIIDLSYKKSNKIKNEILFISERIKSDFSLKSPGYPGTNEFIVLNKILKARRLDTKIIIKLHPQEKKSKYSNLLKKHKNLVVKKKVNLRKMINSCRSVIGISSALLLEIALIRNDVISVIPFHSRNIFFGNLRAITKNAYSIAKLKKIIYRKDKIIKSNSKFQNIFKNSTQKCLASIKNLKN